MTPMDYVRSLPAVAALGLADAALFGARGDGLVSFKADADGNLSFRTWTVPNVPEPAAADLQAALAAPDPAPTGAQLVAYATAKQLALRDGGITVNVGTAAAPQTVDVASDVDGRSLVSGCVQLIGLASQTGQATPSFPWINNDGSSVMLSGAQMMSIGYALGAFVQAGYEILGAALAAIADGTITSDAGVDAASWPSRVC